MISLLHATFCAGPNTPYQTQQTEPAIPANRRETQHMSGRWPACAGYSGTPGGPWGPGFPWKFPLPGSRLQPLLTGTLRQRLLCATEATQQVRPPQLMSHGSRQSSTAFLQEGLKDRSIGLPGAPLWHADPQAPCCPELLDQKSQLSQVPGRVTALPAATSATPLPTTRVSKSASPSSYQPKAPSPQKNYTRKLKKKIAHKYMKGVEESPE